MATTVNFDLSTTLQATLTGSNTTYAYAFAFGSSTASGTAGLVDSVTLVDAGVVQSGLSLSLPSPSFYSGTIYVVVQQNGNGSLKSTIKSTSDIIDNAASGNFSYQLFEATLSGSQFDLGDISLVNTFGLASTFEAVYQSGSQTRGFKASAKSIFDALPADAVANYSPNSFTDPERLATGPATANGAAPWSYEGWRTYVDALKQDAATLSQIQLVHAFNGSALQPEAMLSQYGVRYVKEDKHGKDYFWLVPDNSNGATNKAWIRIPAEELMKNIFGQTGKLEVYPEGQNGPVVQYDSFTPNNAVGGIVMEFVAGFDGGFWGGRGTSANALDTTPMNFNETYSWNINYSYGAALLDGVGAATYTNTLKPADAKATDLFYDPWAKQVIVNSNAYGFSYSDLLSAGGVNPQITLYDTATSRNVETINISLFDTGETPASGYQASSTGWIAPTGGTYAAASTQSSNQIGFNFNFSVGSKTYAPDENTSLVLRIYAPGSAQAGSDGFISLDLKGTTGNWYYYILNKDGSGNWSVQLSNPTNLDGFFNIQGVPVTADGSVGWYQLVFGSGAAQTTYNLYATSDAGSGNFADLVVDRGVGVMENSASNYTLSFAPGGQMLYDIDTFAPQAKAAGTKGVTIHGSKKNDIVNALTSLEGQPLPTGGDDIIYGYRGNDSLSGLGGNDILNGGKGIDVLRGGVGDDILQVEGDEGVYDFFDGGAGTDTLQFIGNDSVTLAGFNASVSLIEIIDGNGRGLLGTKKADVFDLHGLTAANNVPFIDGRGGDDVLIGSDLAEDLRGGAGNDTLEGGGGNDILDGGKGIDVLHGGAGDDILQVRGKQGVSDVFDGGAGTDTLQFIGKKAVKLNGFDAAASSIEILEGNGKKLAGTNAADVFDFTGLAEMTGVLSVQGERGDDVLIGSGFDDVLHGNRGEDILRGGGGNDVLDGGRGDDILDGGAGNDILDGGRGRNTYVFGDGYGADTVVKFNAGKDKFDLRGATGVHAFDDLLMTQVAAKTVLIDFGGGDTLTIHKTTIAVLTANQGDFLFS